jgi:hypothetical protein
LKNLLLFLGLLSLAKSAAANVQVFVQATNGLAYINYNCTAGLDGNDRGDFNDFGTFGDNWTPGQSSKSKQTEIL